MKRALILGGAGFIGSHVGLRLVDEGWLVRLFDIGFTMKAEKQGIELFQGNFFNSNDLDRALEGVKRVYHFVSTTVPSTSKENMEVEVETNLLGSVRLLERMRFLGVSEIVYPSSGGTIYGNVKKVPITEEDKTRPTCSYGFGKLLIENTIRYYSNNYGLQYQILRISNPYGDVKKVNRRQGVIDAFLMNVRNGQSLTIWGTGENVRDFIYIKDLVDATVALDKYGQWNEIYNIGTGKGASVRQIIEIIKEVTGIQVDCTYTENEYSGLSRNVLDISKIQEHVNWSPRYELAEGVKEVWKNLMDH